MLGLLTVLHLSISKAANRRRKGRDGPPTTPSSLAVLHPTLALFCPAEARARCLFTASEALVTTFTEPTKPLRTADTLPCPFTTATHRLGLKPGFEMNAVQTGWTLLYRTRAYSTSARVCACCSSKGRIHPFSQSQQSTPTLTTARQTDTKST